MSVSLYVNSTAVLVPIICVCEWDLQNFCRH